MFSVWEISFPKMTSKFLPCAFPTLLPLGETVQVQAKGCSSLAPGSFSLPIGSWNSHDEVRFPHSCFQYQLWDFLTWVLGICNLSMKQDTAYQCTFRNPASWPSSHSNIDPLAFSSCLRLAITQTIKTFIKEVCSVLDSSCCFLNNSY